MSGTTTDPADSGNDGTTQPDGFKPITSQEDLNRIIAERVNRERGKFADYDAMKAKAAQFDQIEQANKSDVEKANERAAKAEADAEKAKADALRLRIAAKHGISDEDADLFLTATDEATLTKQAERLAQTDADRKKTKNHVPREGTNPNSGTGSDLRDFTRSLFQSAD